MKNRLDEVKRMQKLAGLSSNATKLFLESITVEDVLSEAEVDAKLDTAVKGAFSDAKTKMQAIINSLPKDKLEKTKDNEFEKLSKQDTATSEKTKNPKANKGTDKGQKNEIKKPLNEEGVLLTISFLLAAPAIVIMISKFAKLIKSGIRSVTDKLGFTKPKTEEEKLKGNQKIINKIYRFGKSWESIYLKMIIAGVKLTGFGSSYWTETVNYPNGKTEEVVNKQRLVVMGKYIYGAILALAAIASVYGGLTSAIQGHMALAASEAGVVAIKGMDLKHLQDATKGQMGGEFDTNYKSPRDASGKERELDYHFGQYEKPNTPGKKS